MAKADGGTTPAPSRWARTIAIAVVLVALATSCGGAAASGGGRPHVVAAEDFWGSIAEQLGGDRVEVSSIITNPNADPHEYEPTTADARELATATFVIENGIGYDPWAQKLLDANPVPSRDVLDLGTLLGVSVGGNPHVWYSPPDVQRVIDAVTVEYKRIDPKNASYFDRRRASFETKGLAEYHRLISEIRARYAGTPVGASESIFAYMAPALGLKLITPDSFLTAISEGAEPSAGDKATIDRQISSHEVKIYVYNSQNATPDIQRQIEAARAAGIPVTTITETLVPADATFQSWQVRELQGIEAALRRATGR
jgi:zinc/manganese transport system substrate-binding protein